MKEVALPESSSAADTASFLACVATILELAYERIPSPARGEDPATGWTVTRWLGGLGLGLVPIAAPASFAWPGPWIARLRPPDAGDRRSVRHVRGAFWRRLGPGGRSGRE